MKTIILISILGIASLFGGIFNVKNAILLIFILIGLILGVIFNINDWNTSIKYFNEMIWYVLIIFYVFFQYFNHSFFN